MTAPAHGNDYTSLIRTTAVRDEEFVLLIQLFLHLLKSHQFEICTLHLVARLNEALISSWRWRASLRFIRPAVTINITGTVANSVCSFLASPRQNAIKTKIRTE